MICFHNSELSNYVGERDLSNQQQQNNEQREEQLRRRENERNYRQQQNDKQREERLRIEGERTKGAIDSNRIRSSEKGDYTQKEEIAKQSI